MNIKILSKYDEIDFPFDWVNLDYLPDSKGQKIEIYLLEREQFFNGLILMFYILFGNTKNNIKIYNNSWWDFCLDTWNHNEDSYSYELEGKTQESKDYLTMLIKSDIEKGYSGICMCENWEKFLSIILACILTHQAPYSPVFYDKDNNFFFYFHHTGSIGLYYKSENDNIHKILNIAKEEYELVSNKRFNRH
ncbi:MAG: hypothetical protein JNL70_03000 [Saprospiraceae bacterium]|nr:hypothetical protein [Saprospiraceae bacterium]